MSALTVQDEIEALIRSIPNTTVFVGLSSEEVIAMVKEQVNFITINFGALIKPRKGVNGIVGAAYDSNYMGFTVRCISNKERNTRVMNQAVWDTVVGHVPAGAGEIGPVLFGGIGEISALGNPTRYAAVQSYDCLVDSDKVNL